MSEQRNDFHNLRTERKRLHLLVKPTGAVSGMAMDNVGWQMRHSAKLLEKELAQAGEARVVQFATYGENEREPERWELFADGKMVASGTGDFARSCFEESAERFLETLREAVAANADERFSDSELRVLEAARNVARAEAALYSGVPAWMR